MRVLDKDLIHVAPAPVLPRLERPDYWVPGGMEVLRSMSVLRCVATTHVAAGEALPEVDPRVTNLQALFAALRRGLHVPDLVRVVTGSGEPSEHLGVLLRYPPRGRRFVFGLFGFFGAHAALALPDLTLPLSGVPHVGPPPSF
jgi:hypothetical protein